MKKRKPALPGEADERWRVATRVQRLRAALEEMTQEELARRAGVGRVQIQKIEAAKCDITQQTWTKVAQALFIPVDEIDPHNCANWKFQDDSDLIQHAKERQEHLLKPTDPSLMGVAVEAPKHADTPDRAQAEVQAISNMGGSPMDVDIGDSSRDLPEQYKGKIFFRFRKCTVAQNDFERESAKVLRRTHKLELKWLGMAMDYGAPLFPDALRTMIAEVAECEVKVSIAMLHPEWDCLELLHPQWPTKVPASFKELNALAALYRDQSSGPKKVNIMVRRYKYVPNWHGFVINDSRFYISTCSWAEDVPGGDRRLLVGGENPYILVHAEKGGIERWMATMFSGWFDFAFNWETTSSVIEKRTDDERR